MTEEKNLTILWTNADINTSKFMVMMYATNSMIYHWWDSVTVVIWGATAKLVAEDESIQELLKTAANVGVSFSACVACARQLGVKDELKALGIEVKPWGEPLSQLIQGGGHLITV